MAASQPQPIKNKLQSAYTQQLTHIHIASFLYVLLPYWQTDRTHKYEGCCLVGRQATSNDRLKRHYSAARLHGVTSRKAATFIITAKTIPDLTVTLLKTHSRGENKESDRTNRLKKKNNC